MLQRSLPSAPADACIAVVAPSGALLPQFLQQAVDLLRQAGFRVKVMPHVAGSAVSVFAAPDDLRADDLRAALADPDVDAVWCARGGYGAVRTIQALSQDVFAASDKVIVGFSDITAIHSLSVRAGHVAILGPMLKHIATHGLLSPDVANTFALLRRQPVSIACNALPGSRPGTVSAPLVGGNLSILYSLRATPADVIPDGNILFIEDLCEYNYHIDRMMQNLRFSGLLARISGLIVGQMTDMKDGATPFGKDAYQIIADAVADYDYPVLLGFPSGHDPAVNQPLLLGATASLAVNPDGSASLSMQIP